MERDLLARVNPATGQIQATRRLDAAFGQAIETAGSLWVVIFTPARETLLRLDLRTLKPDGQWWVAANPLHRTGSQVLAAAGGGLWVDGAGRLLRLSLPAAHITTRVSLAPAASSGVSANAAGTNLVVSRADNAGRGAVERRDPVTGRILASHPILGLAAATIAGPAGPAVWVAEPTGMMGFVQRLDARTLRPGTSRCTEGEDTGTCLTGSNGITVTLADGLLWITDPAAGSSRNICADPVTGRVLAPIRLPHPAQDFILAIGRHRIYYAAPAHGSRQYVREAAFPAACRAP